MAQRHRSSAPPILKLSVTQTLSQSHFLLGVNTTITIGVRLILRLGSRLRLGLVILCRLPLSLHLKQYKSNPNPKANFKHNPDPVQHPTHDDDPEPEP